jgi:hypothetical protein
MISQPYFIIKDDVVVTTVIWDGDTTQWTPPEGSIAIVQATTPALIWYPVYVDKVVTDFVLTQEIGAGQNGFTWDGSVLTTNEPKPKIPDQPVATGVQTI